MRGTVKKDAPRGSWYFVIDVGPDAATGKRRQTAPTRVRDAQECRGGAPFRAVRVARGRVRRAVEPARAHLPGALACCGCGRSQAFDRGDVRTQDAAIRHPANWRDALAPGRRGNARRALRRAPDERRPPPEEWRTGSARGANRRGGAPHSSPSLPGRGTPTHHSIESRRRRHRASIDGAT